jgi:hypothetical protein
MQSIVIANPAFVYHAVRRLPVRSSVKEAQLTKLISKGQQSSTFPYNCAQGFPKGSLLNLKGQQRVAHAFLEQRGENEGRKAGANGQPGGNSGFLHDLKMRFRRCDPVQLTQEHALLKHLEFCRLVWRLAHA